MNDIYQVTAQPRTEVGKGASRRLRREEAVPAILYGAGQPAENLTLNHHEMTRALKNEGFYSRVLTLLIGEKKVKAVLKALQRHPYKPKIMHADFLRIDENEKLHVNVPLHFVNADTAPGVKLGGGLVTHLKTELRISCLPNDLPEYIEVDLGNLELGSSIHASELALPAGVELYKFHQENDFAVVNILATRAAKADDEENSEEGSKEA